MKNYGSEKVLVSSWLFKGPRAIAIYDNLRLQAQVAYLNSDISQGGKLVDQVLENYRQNSNPIK